MFAQGPDIEWQRSLGGSYYDEATAILQTSDGGYVIAGVSSSFDGDVVGNHPNPSASLPADAWIVKLSSTGAIIWQHCLGSEWWEGAYSIDETDEGGFIVAAYMSGDYWILKLNSTGLTEWERSYGGSQADTPYSIQQTSEGGFIVVGGSSSDDGDIVGHHGSPFIPNLDSWVIKLDNFGEIEWQKSLGGSADDVGKSIHQTVDGGFVLAGYTSSDDGDVIGLHESEFGSYSDSWIVKLDNSGNVEWQRCLGGSKGDRALSVRQTTDNGFILTGSTNSDDGDVSGLHLSESGLDSDCWVVKLDDIGAIQWQNCLGGSNSDGGTCIQECLTGGFIVGGYTNSQDGDVAGSHATPGLLLDDYWIVKINNAGSIEWQQCLGGVSPEMSTSFDQTSDGGLIVAGWSYSYDGDVTSNNGATDYWIVKLSSVTMVGEWENQNISIYPIPTKGLLNVILPSVTKSEFSVVSALGCEILRGYVGDEMNTIDLTGEAPGLYIVKVNIGRNSSKVKVILE